MVDASGKRDSAQRANAPVTLREALYRSRSGGRLTPDETRKEKFIEHLKMLGVVCPDEVAVELLPKHGQDDKFMEEYGGIDLRQVEWELQDWHADELNRVSVLGRMKERVEGVAENLPYWASAYEGHGDRWGWNTRGTWLTPPLVIGEDLLGIAGGGWRLVEGHTRLGALKGYLQNGVIGPRSKHSVWVGRRRALSEGSE